MSPYTAASFAVAVLALTGLLGYIAHEEGSAGVERIIDALARFVTTVTSARWRR